MYSKEFYLVAAIILFIADLPAQTRLSCDSLKNVFLQPSQIESIRSVVDTIYPSGKIYYKRDSIIGFSELISLMNLDSNITFDSQKAISGPSDTNEVYIRYQEYYKGVKVTGGGYTESYFASPGGGTDPCLEPYAGNAYILSGIDLNVVESKPVWQIASYQGLTPIDSSQIYIELNNYCEYNIFYNITYEDSNSNVITSKFNAITGLVIGILDLDEFGKFARTRDFGLKEMNASQFDINTSWLVSHDNNLISYNYHGVSWGETLGRLVRTGLEPSDQYIPTVANSEEYWPMDEDAETTYQSHYIADGIMVQLKNDFNIEFDSCVLICNTIKTAAFNVGGIVNMPHGSLKKAVIVVGDYEINGHEYTWAFPSIIGHELAHPILHTYGLDFDTENDTAEPDVSLHEGISEMFAVYLRSKLNNEAIIWETGDENDYTEVPNSLNDPFYKCFEDVTDFESVDQVYERAQPLTYWFYLCVNGNELLNIPPINAKSVLDIILSAVIDISSKSDYKQLMEGTLNNALEKYGRCSDEFVALARAWEAICVPTGFVDPITHEIPQCNFSLEGPIWVCEENEYLNVNLVNYFSNYQYIWTLIGQKNTEYESTYGMTGNGQYGGYNIELIDFPTHNYYTQRLTIKVYCPNLGSQYNAKFTVKLVDCESDDPTCHEYYENFAFHPEDSRPNVDNFEPSKILNNNEFSEGYSEKQYYLTKVYSITGQLLFSGDINLFDSESTTFPWSLYFLVHYNENGKYIRVEKKVYLY